jgi:biopolymer transport protein ExbD/biopolymer transport protein TolR
VDVGNDHSIRLNQMVVTLQELGDKLTLVFSARGNRSMFIRGFSKLAYGEVFQVLDIAQRSGATNIALIKSDEESAKAQGDQ